MGGRGRSQSYYFDNIVGTWDHWKEGVTAKVTAAVRTLFGKLEGRGESQSYCCENLVKATRQPRESSFTLSDTLSISVEVEGGRKG